MSTVYSINRDLVAGLVFSALGVAFMSLSAGYDLGSASRMGPGYFPMLLGGVLLAIGVLIALTGIRARSAEAVGHVALRPLLCILAANAAFGLLLGGVRSIGLPPMGMIPAIYALVALAAMSEGRYRPKEVLLEGTILAVGSYLLFVKALGLNVPALPAFL